MMVWLTLCIVAWIGCGVLSYGMGFAFLQREYPIIAEQEYRRDMVFSAFMALFGPANVVGVLSMGYSPSVHGLKWK